MSLRDSAHTGEKQAKRSNIRAGHPAQCRTQLDAVIARSLTGYAECHGLLSTESSPFPERSLLAVPCRSFSLLSIRSPNHRNGSSCPVRSVFLFPSWCPWHRFSRHPLRPALAPLLLCASSLIALRKAHRKAVSVPPQSSQGLRLSQTRRKTLRSPKKARPKFGSNQPRVFVPKHSRAERRKKLT